MVSPQNSFSGFLAPRGPTVKTIQTLLQRIGGATSGSKDVLRARLFKELAKRDGVMAPSAAVQRVYSGLRVLSIDMGIRNLAYCLADVDFPASRAESTSTSMHVRAWRRMDLMEMMRKANANAEDVGTVDRHEGEKELDPVPALADEDADPFSPDALSRMACWLLRNHLLSWSPDVILIERQRWRSASSSAVQQWTLRVNSLEAMLWAVLEALRSVQGDAVASTNSWTVYAVDPKRVSSYWLDDDMTVQPSRAAPGRRKQAAKGEQVASDSDLPASSSSSVATIDLESDSVTSVPKRKLTRGKAEKRAKISLLRTWLDSTHPSTSLAYHSNPTRNPNFNPADPASSRPEITFIFPPHSSSPSSLSTTTTTASTSHQPPSSTSNPSSPSSDPTSTLHTLLFATSARKPADAARWPLLQREEVKKVDDVADCFLQAAAWVAWGVERRRLAVDWEGVREQVLLSGKDVEKGDEEEPAKAAGTAKSKTKKEKKTRGKRKKKV